MAAPLIWLRVPLPRIPAAEISSRRIAGRRYGPRLDAAFGADKQHLVGRVARQKLFGNGDAREEVPAGAATGNDQFHFSSLRLMEEIFSPDEMLSRMPTANRLISRELPP